MTQISVEEVKKIAEKISNFTRKTPTVRSLFHSDKYSAKIALKLENLNVTGSFKIRGASNAILEADQELVKNGIVAASAGNHAQGVAYACRELGLKSTVFMPEGTPYVKAYRTKQLGSDIVLKGETYDDAYNAAKDFGEKNRMFMVHPFADLNVVKGQATIGKELLEQVPDLGAVVIPVGGGGMVSGIGAYIKQVDPSIKIIGVQTTAYPALKESFYSDELVKTAQQPTIADGIAVKNVSQMNLDFIKKYVDKMICVSESEIAEGIMELMEHNRVVAEGAAATSVAALAYLEDEIKEISKKDKSIICLVCGGNIDANLLSKVVNRGLHHSGRLMQLQVGIKDRPGALAELLGSIAEANANILEVHHERVFGNRNFKDVDVDLELEVTDLDHQAFLTKSLIEKGYSIIRKS